MLALVTSTLHDSKLGGECGLRRHALWYSIEGYGKDATLRGTRVAGGVANNNATSEPRERGHVECTWGRHTQSIPG